MGIGCPLEKKLWTTFYDKQMAGEPGVTTLSNYQNLRHLEAALMTHGQNRPFSESQFYQAQKLGFQRYEQAILLSMALERQWSSGLGSVANKSPA